MDIVSEIIEHEGRAYTNRPADHGGPTKFGITLATLSKWRKRACTAADVAALTEAEARLIYEATYLHPFDAVKDIKVREQLVDFGVTSGPDTVVKLVQGLLGQVPDGVLGPVTAAAINAQPALGNRLACERAKFYVHIAQHDPSQLVNLGGWVNRALGYVS